MSNTTPRKIVRKPTPQPAPALPADVRWTNAAAAAAAVLAVVLVLMAAALWAARWHGLALREVQIEGRLQRSNLPTIRAHVLPRIQGNFFSVKLADVRKAFESTPWVRHAVVRRVWPDTLVVRLEEHQAAALWEGGGGGLGDDRLVNSQGEVFEAPAADLEETPDGTTLPTLIGPQGSAAVMLALYHRLAPLLAEVDQQIETLELSERGSWRAETRGNAVIELGRGDADQVVGRTSVFVRTVASATQKWRAPLEVADLRHSDGYAVRLRGISVSTAASAAAATATTRTN